MDNLQKGAIVAVIALIGVVTVIVLTSIDWATIGDRGLIGGTSSLRVLEKDMTYSEKPVEDFLYGRDLTFTGRVINEGSGDSGVVQVEITLWADEALTTDLDHFTTTTSPAVLEPGEDGSFIKTVNERELITTNWNYYTVDVTEM